MGLNVHISHEVFRGCDGEAAPYVEICIEASAPRRPLIAMALLHEGLHNAQCAHVRALQSGDALGQNVLHVQLFVRKKVPI